MTTAEKVERWPFLKIDDKLCWDDDLPDGWSKAFGRFVWDEIADVLKRNNDTLKIKAIESLSGFMLRYTCGTKSNEEIWKIVYKYNLLSRHICMKCGKPDTPLLMRDLCVPICKKCFADAYIVKGLSPEEYDKYYDEIKGDEGSMPDAITFEDEKISVKDIADRIRRNYDAKK